MINNSSTHYSYAYAEAMTSLSLGAARLCKQLFAQLFRSLKNTFDNLKSHLPLHTSSNSLEGRVNASPPPPTPLTEEEITLLTEAATEAPRTLSETMELARMLLLAERMPDDDRKAAVVATRSALQASLEATKQASLTTFTACLSPLATALGARQESLSSLQLLRSDGVYGGAVIRYTKEIEEKESAINAKQAELDNNTTALYQEEALLAQSRCDASTYETALAMTQEGLQELRGRYPHLGEDLSLYLTQKPLAREDAATLALTRYRLDEKYAALEEKEKALQALAEQVKKGENLPRAQASLYTLTGKRPPETLKNSFMQFGRELGFLTSQKAPSLTETLEAELEAELAQVAAERAAVASEWKEVVVHHESDLFASKKETDGITWTTLTSQQAQAEGALASRKARVTELEETCATLQQEHNELAKALTTLHTQKSSAEASLKELKATQTQNIESARLKLQKANQSLSEHKQTTADAYTAFQVATAALEVASSPVFCGRNFNPRTHQYTYYVPDSASKVCQKTLENELGKLETSDVFKKAIRENCSYLTDEAFKAVQHLTRSDAEED